MKETKRAFTPEMARIHAHLCGDGCVYSKRERYSQRQLEQHPRRVTHETVWVAEYVNTCPELREEFINDMKEAFNRKGVRETKWFRVRVSSAKWIIEELELMGKNSYTWFIPKRVIEAEQEIIASWLRAFFDDESTVSVKQKMIRIKSVNLKGLQQVKLLLEKLQMSPRITGPNCDRTHYLNIYRKDLGTYAKYVGFTHPDKREKIRKMGPP